MKVIYMEKTLQLIAKTQGVEVAKAIEETGEINYLGDTPYLVVKINDENVVGVEN
jgi:hypothetical protein